MLRGGECIRSNQKYSLNDNRIFNKLIESSGKCNPKSKIIFLSLFISGIVKVESNTFYSCEYEYTICVLYKIQTGCCK